MEECQIGNLVKLVISIAIMLRIVGSTLSLVGSGRHSIVAPINWWAQLGGGHGGCVPPLFQTVGI